MRADGKIEVKSWEQSAYDKNDALDINEIRVSETFSGDLAGEGTVRFLQAAKKDGSWASFCGIERFVGKLGGKSGSFLLQDTGTLEGQNVKGTWFVVPGSATGELAGLRGEGGFEAVLGQHSSCWLDYRFEP